MLQSLEIRNYRNLRHLTIEKLGRVNLLVGKNNTGKTSVLEAVGIYVNKGNLPYLIQLLDERGENYIRRNPNLTEDDVLKTLSALFTDRRAGYSPTEQIVIRDEKLTDEFSLAIDTGIRLRLTRYIETPEPVSGSQLLRTNRIPVDADYTELGNHLGVELIADSTLRIIPLSFFERNLSSRFFSNDGIIVKNQFVRTKNIDREINGTLWDAIALTDKENVVIDALRIVDIGVERVTFVNRNDRSDERLPVIRLKKDSEIIPLRSMGDGINRILTIILAMVNCENGYLLIDEFENGLHYSVQEKLWEIIFDLAEQLNIQVFATTHSFDCIEAFSAVLSNGKQDKDTGAMIRLENYEGNIEATVYDADEIQATTRVQVDPR